MAEGKPGQTDTHAAAAADVDDVDDVDADDGSDEGSYTRNMDIVSFLLNAVNSPIAERKGSAASQNLKHEKDEK